MTLGKKSILVTGARASSGATWWTVLPKKPRPTWWC